MSICRIIRGSDSDFIIYIFFFWSHIFNQVHRNSCSHTHHTHRMCNTFKSIHFISLEWMMKLSIFGVGFVWATFSAQFVWMDIGGAGRRGTRLNQPINTKRAFVFAVIIAHFVSSERLLNGFSTRFNTLYMYTYKICRIYADVRASKIYYTHYEHLSTRNTTRTPYRYVGYILLYLSIALCTANELHVCRNAIITLGLVLLAMLHLVANVYSAPPHQAYSMS